MNYSKLSDDILDQIIYRGEGNSSIVVSLKEQAKVIRLLKKDGKIMRFSKDHHATQHPMRSIEFIHLIMRPLTDPFLSGETELIHLKSDLINALSKRVEAYRPLHRLDKTLLLDDQYALVMDDLCTLPTKVTKLLNEDDLTGPTISVEIKPKQGFLPIHKLAMKSSLNDQSTMKMRNCCIYGSNQFLKLARGRINQTSDYCPINLFSGCPVKIRDALEELVNNPQNNLRIFKDLKLAYGDSKQVKLSNILNNFFTDNIDQANPFNYEDRIIDLLIKCLLDDHDKSLSNSHEPINSDDENSFSIGETCLRHHLKIRCKCCDSMASTFAINHKLPKSCVLSSVLKAQRLDTIGAHEALFMLNWLLENSKKDELDILEELSKPHLPPGFGTIHQLNNESKHQYYFRKVWEFLVSLTAKDCSIIVTIRQITPGRYESIVDLNPNLRKCIIKDENYHCSYLFNVGIADLDQKMPLKIPRICDNLSLIFQSKSDIMKKDTPTTQKKANHKVLIDSS